MPETLILVGDAYQRLKDLGDNTFNVCVTSPPYYGLRDYGTGTWTGGNNPNCEHVKHFRSKLAQGVQGRVEYEEGVREAERLGATPPTINNRYPSAGRALGNGRFACELCGAERIDLQIGLEPDYLEYIDRMVDVCKEIKRVLRPDGCFFLNIGDSYTTSTGNKKIGLKPKNLIQVPARLMMRLQEDGWYLRSEIIWAKTAHMPEKVDDRPTIMHEKIYLLTKSADYSFDGYAVDDHAAANGNIRSVWFLGPEVTPDFHFATFPSEVPRRAILLGLGRAGVCAKCGKPWKSTKNRNWLPDCTCDSKAKSVGGMVLDPFLGSGTTAMVANSLGHDCIGIELNEEIASKSRLRIIGNGRFTNEVTIDSHLP
jgi:site-specific DNA-methyltransferase (cytosine-N4-specific)